MFTSCWISANGNSSAALSATAQQQATRALFNYEANKLPELTQISSSFLDGVVVRDIEFAATGSQRGRVKAYVINPQTRDALTVNQYAGILYFHWLGESNSNRQEFFAEASAMSKRGAVAVLVEGYFP